MAVAAPTFSFPFRVVNGRVAVVEQNSARDLEQCIHATLSTPYGSRLEAPDYGRPNGELFKQQQPAGVNVDPYLAAIARDEPRAHVLADGEIEDLVERFRFRREP